MRLLILTQYFPPEVGAPQNRLYELAVRLKKAGVDVTVLTAMPNYPRMVIHPEYAGKKYAMEEMGGITVHRSSIYVSTDRSIVKRLRNYFSFVLSSWRTGRRLDGPFDFIFCESPPLFLGISALLLARCFKARMIFNVSDLWPESAEKLGLVTNRVLLKAATILEERLYRSSSLITGQTQGIVRNIRSRFPQKEVYWLPNGVDLEYYNPDSFDRSWRTEAGFREQDFLVLYAGIIGHAQGLEVILDAAERLRDHPRIRFLMLGDGPEKERLTASAAGRRLTNVVFLDPVPKAKMPFVVSASDAAVVPLKRLELFKGAIPSKIFESLAMRKPVLLGVEGEAKELFIEEGKCGIAFTPESDSELAEGVLKLSGDKELLLRLGENARAYAASRFDRNRIAADFLHQLEKSYSTRSRG
ncbi:MAG: hypothetical protein RL213_2227 [Bacteroidota bacterium]